MDHQYFLFVLKQKKLKLKRLDNSGGELHV